jgi:hypothetical protein
MIAYDDPSILYKYNLKKMRSNGWDSASPPVAQRFVLPLISDISKVANGENLVTIAKCEATAVKKEKGIIFLTPEQLGPVGFELPGINKRFNTRKYRYIYGCGAFEQGYYVNSVCKIDIDTKRVQLWRESETQFPGEPVFIPKPGGSSEDDGLLLSLVLDTAEEKPHFLLVLNAQTLEEVGRAEVPLDVQIPTTIHGLFVPN